jgi:glycosyltransferase involved in cell wall biosynthesis
MTAPLEPGDELETPLVTIAIPSRDRGDLLHRALRSALAQTDVSVEVIVVDDGSVDPVALDPDPRVTLVRIETSRGVCAARNVALARARGRWIAFLDDDDELRSDFAEVALRAAAGSTLPPPVAVLAAIEVVDADGRPREVRWPTTVLRGGSFFAADSGKPQFQFANSLLAPAEVIRSIGGWDERFRAWEVEDFLIRLSRAASLQGISDQTYRIHDHLGPRLGGDREAMIEGAQLTLREYHDELEADRSRHARYLGAMAFIQMQDGRPLPAIRSLWSSFTLDPRLPRRPDHWITALTRSARRSRTVGESGRTHPPSARLGTTNAIGAIAMPGDPEPKADSGMAAAAPRVSIGLVVFNGERFLSSAIDSLLAQTFSDFELLISDNGSTDGTQGIAGAAAARDERIRYVRHSRNRGLAWNLNFVVGQARGEFFMWAGHDDLHEPEFIERCVGVLVDNPGVVYAYGNTFLIDGEGTVFGREINRFELGVRSPNRRFWEQLVVRGGQNFYGIIRSSVLRSIAPHGSIPWSERVMFAELSLHGRFALVKGATFYWRRHPEQLTAIWGSRRAFTDALDPARPAWRRSTPMLLVEYVVGYAAAIWRAPLSVGEKLRCYARLARWLLGHVPGFAIDDPRAVGAEIAQIGPDDQAGAACSSPPADPPPFTP